MEVLNNILASLHFNLGVFVFQVVAFVVFHYAMRATIYEPLMKARGEREGRISGSLAKAEQAAANAQAMKAQYDEEIKSLRQQLAGELKSETEAAEKAAAARLATARTEAGGVLDEANARLDQEASQLRSGMSEQAGRLAQAVAEKIVRNNLTPEAQARALATMGGRTDLGGSRGV